MKTYSLRSIFCAAILTATATVNAAVLPAENLLPADTLAFFTVPDFNALRAAAKQSPQVLLWNDPAMRPFHDKFMAKWNSELMAPLEKDLGIKFNDYAALPQGQFTLAITQNGWLGTDSADPGLLLLVDTKDKSGVLKTNLTALQKKWRASGKAVRTETVRGISFTVVPISSNDIPSTLSKLLPHQAPVQELGKENKPAKPGTLVVGQMDSLLIVGNSLKAVEPVVAHLSHGAAPSLNDDAVFAADKLAQFRDAPLYYGWFNSKTLFGIIANLPEAEANPQAPTLLPQFSPNIILKASGLLGLKSASFVYRESHDGSQFNIYLSAPDVSRQGFLKIIAAAAKDSSAPPFVPGDAVKFSRWRIDGQKSINEFEKMLGSISPGIMSYFNTAIDMINGTQQAKDASFDIRKNLFGNLGDDFISYQKAPVGESLQNLNNPPSLFLFAAANPDQTIQAISTIGMMMISQGSPEPRDFQGRKVYTITLPGARTPNAAATPSTRSLYYSTSGGYVAMSGDVSMLEEYLRSNSGQVKPLRATPGLAEAAQHIGGMGTGLFGYENQRETMRSVFMLLKNNSNPTASPLASLPANLREWMDFSLLPDFDKVGRYFYFSVYSGTTTPDGILFQAFAPRPPQMQ